jgi:nickel-dependent lactate racemase
MVVDVSVAYGSEHISVDLPAERSTVVSSHYRTAVLAEQAEVSRSLRDPVAGRPLRDRVRRGSTVAISVCDVTRPQPRRVVIPAVLEELDGIVALDDIVILVATGTHRPSTSEELRQMFGDAVVDAVRIVDHDAREASSHVWCGVHGAGVPVWLNREWVAADVRITTGFVEPHFFAGFSGGPKMVAPGLAALETVLTLHDARRIGHPRARWGITSGNPVHDDIRAIAEATGVDMSVDVVLNRDQKIVRSFAGDIFAVHTAARRLSRELSMRQVDGEYDVVVTSNAGYPLDQNLYQTVKGMSAAAQIVRPGGIIIMAAECRDGFPDHGSFREQLTSAASPDDLLQDIEHRSRTVPDQWQLQILAHIRRRAEIRMFTTGLSRIEIQAAHMHYVDDVSDAVHAALKERGDQARVCVLPEGPLTVPYVAPAA